MNNMREEAVKAVKTLQSHNKIAVFAGGCVRDKLLGLEPKDFDIATSATPDEIESLFPNTIPVGKAFGVIIVVSNDFQFEVATLRKDSEESDGRRPNKVEFVSDLKQDASRRDFTINAMFEDPISGKIIDHFKGKKHLKEKRIVFVGDPQKRIEEDKLRMLRAIRFATQKGFVIDDSARGAIFANSHKITEVSWERIKMELDKILLSSNPSNGFFNLHKSELLKEILPELEETLFCKQNPRWHSEGQVFFHTLLTVNTARSKTDDLNCLWGALLHDIGKPKCFSVDENGNEHHFGHDEEGVEIAEKILRRMKSSVSQIETVKSIVKEHMRIKKVGDMKKSKVLRLMAHPHFDQIRLVSECDSRSAICQDPEDQKNKLKWLEVFDKVEVPEDFGKELPKPIITGKDLIAIGLKPGPEFKAILDKMMDAQLEGFLTSKEACIQQILEEMV